MSFLQRKKVSLLFTNALWSRYNSSISSMRREVLNGVYDVHTNFMHYPKIMQPSHVRWEQVPSSESSTSTKLAEGLSTLNLANGTTASEERDENDQAESAVARQQAEASDKTAPSILPPVPAVFTRRFAIMDVHYETPESSTLGRPGPDGDIHDLGSNGITSMTDLLHPEFASPEVLAELPAECKEALIETAAQEWAWKSKWRNEATDGSRAQVLRSYSWYP